MTNNRLSSRGNRRNRRANRVVSQRKTTTTTALVPIAPPMQRTTRIPRRIPKPMIHPKITEAGLAFLKCAFASPDFSVDPGKGIPDEYTGRTLAIKDCSTVPLEFSGATAATDTYIVIAPVPGYAYFRADVPQGTLLDHSTPLVGVTYPTYATNFGTGPNNQLRVNNFSRFRYASLAAGLYPTVNYMQFNGSVQVWKIQASLGSASSQVTGSADLQDYMSLHAFGLQGITPIAPRDNYSQSFIKGMYSFATNQEPDFEWCEFQYAGSYSSVGPRSTSVATGTQTLVSDGTYNLTGLGNLETIVIKVSTPSGTTNTALLKTWNCIELQPNTNSSLYQFSGTSPFLDPIAIQMYNIMKNRYPVAVCCEENAKFWENVLKVLQATLRAGSFIPGPAGIISGGLSTATDALAALVL